MGRCDPRYPKLNRRQNFMKLPIWLMVTVTLGFVFGWTAGNRLRPYIRPEHKKLIAKYSMSLSLDPHLVESIVLTESGGNAGAISPKGARGLMQILPSTGRQLAEELGLADVPDLLDPELNIHLGCYYLHSLLRKFNGELTLALAAYNTGPYRVKEWIGKHPNLSPTEIICLEGSEETKFFVLRVLRRYENSRDKRIGEKIPQEGGGG